MKFNKTVLWLNGVERRGVFDPKSTKLDKYIVLVVWLFGILHYFSTYISVINSLKYYFYYDQFLIIKSTLFLFYRKFSIKTLEFLKKKK